MSVCLTCGAFKKLPMSRAQSRTIQSESLEVGPRIGSFFLSTLDVNMQLGLRTSIVEVLIQGLGVRPGTVCCE